MKLLIEIVLCLLFVAGTVCAAEPVTSVEVLTPLKSGPVARIVVTLNGKPAPSECRDVGGTAEGSPGWSAVCGTLGRSAKHTHLSAEGVRAALA